MMTISRFVPRLAAALLVFALTQTRLFAQDAVEPPAPPPVQNMAIPFDHLAFGDRGDARAARGRLEEELTLRLDRIDRVCALEPAQKKKLELAGRGEIKRNFDQIDALKRRYDAIVKAHGTPKEFEPITGDLAKLPLAGDRASFEYASLFQKICKSTLSPEQAALDRADRRAARELAHRARVHFVVEALDAMAGLTHDQRVKLAELIRAETIAARRLGATEEEFLIFISLTARIPEAKIKPLFAAEQWRGVGKLLALWNEVTMAAAKLLESLPPDPDLPPPVANRAQP